VATGKTRSLTVDSQVRLTISDEDQLKRSKYSLLNTGSLGQVLNVAAVHVCSYFRDLLSIMFEFIPMVLFLVAMFGYLDFLIIFKWILFNGKLSQCAPSILISQYSSCACCV